MTFGKVFAAAFLAALLSACASQPEYTISDVTEARALSDYALDLFIAGDHDGALRALNAVIAYGSIDASAYARRAAVYGTQKNYEKALADANQAVELAPSAWRGYLERAILFQRVGEYASAIVDLDSAVDLAPNQIELLRRRAYLKVVAARFDDAVADYEMLSRVQPRSDTGALGRGAALYLAGRWPEAATQFNDMLKKQPADGLAALWLAKSRYRAGQFLAWEELEPGAGDEPEWLMTRALLTMNSEVDVGTLLANVERCERTLFLGFWRIVHQRGEGAALEFEAAEEACPRDSIEASETRIELTRLRQAIKPISLAP
jgi:tetratricopeptide (TPR) repeat protein